MQRLAVEEAADRARGLTNRSHPVGTTERRGCEVVATGAETWTASLGAMGATGTADVSAIATDALERAGSKTPGTAAARAADVRPRTRKDRNRADITRPASVAGG